MYPPLSQPHYSRPSWSNNHETNHISSSTYHASHSRPENHFGLIDDNDFAPVADAVFSNNHQYGSNSYNDQHEDNEYRPSQGINFELQNLKKNSNCTEFSTQHQ